MTIPVFAVELNRTEGKTPGRNRVHGDCRTGSGKSGGKGGAGHIDESGRRPQTVCNDHRDGPGSFEKTSRGRCGVVFPDIKAGNEQTCPFGELNCFYIVKTRRINLEFVSAHGIGGIGKYFALGLRSNWTMLAGNEQYKSIGRGKIVQTVYISPYISHIGSGTTVCHNQTFAAGNQFLQPETAVKKTETAS